MKIKNLILMMILTVTLALLLSGCAGGSDKDLEGKSIVTFEVNGGTLSYGTSSTKTKLNFAYHPGTYIIDPTTIPNYSIIRSGYNFTGWYTGEECRPDELWDFTKPFEAEALTLYAGWEKAIKYSYTLYYTNGSDEIALGSYSVSAGEPFEDWRRFAADRENYTGIGYFSDAACTEAWDDSFTHPGGDVDTDVKVYVKYIEGNWQLAGSYDQLRSAVSRGNVYLTDNIDCGGKELALGDFNKIFEGNGYTVSNFTVAKSGTPINPSVAVFKSLGETADVRNVHFEDVILRFVGISDDARVVPNVAALAVKMSVGAKVTGVSVTGTLLTDRDGEFPCLEEVYYHKDAADPDILAGVTDFEATMTVDTQS